MCDNAAAGSVVVVLLIVNALLRNPVRLWVPTQIILALGATVSLPGPLLRLGLFGVPGAQLCLDQRAGTAYLWIWGICILLAAANLLMSFGTSRSDKS
jgi:hypothetical protein